ncbi:MAG TPA: efflux RND transporter periplasmic adaptor subunit [Crenotrichaceae bacterium]|nr:efflux RND transporter periplasmic adaptor subunit [Crenotrichaceae bacterium]
MNRLKWIISALAILVLIFVILFALGIIGGGEKVEPGNVTVHAKPLPANAKTLTLGKQQSDNTLSWPATIRSRSVARIAPKFSARIIEITVDASDKVNKGDVLARLDEQAMRAAYQQALAALNAAKAQAQRAIADEKRIIGLYEKEAATRQSYDAAVAQANSARAAVKRATSAVRQAKVNLGENVLRAPFDGVISERLKEPGDMGLPGDPVVILTKTDHLRVEAAIPTSCANKLSVGDAVGVRIDSFNVKTTGTVDEIVPEIDPATRTQLVKASLPDNPELSAKLTPGLFAWLEQGCEGHQNVLMIPVSAVVRYGQLETVTVVEGNQLHTRHIRTGKQNGDQVEVLSGLSEGETILINSGL